MGEAIIPVDLRNPGQVFACLGFLEAADILCGPAEGGFDWTSDERFILRAEGAENPVEAVLEFLATASIRRIVPVGWIDPPRKNKRDRVAEDSAAEEDVSSSHVSLEFPARSGERMAMPIRVIGGLASITLGHWADGSGRNTFKLYAGNRSAAKIADDMLGMIRDLWTKHRAETLRTPFDACPLAGRFNFDARGAWTAIDAGYSPDEHKVKGTSVHASPVVEFMAAWGLEYARPLEFGVRELRYAVWRDFLPPTLARATAADCLAAIPTRRFRFPLALSGKNKVVCFAAEDAKNA